MEKKVSEVITKRVSFMEGVVKEIRKRLKRSIEVTSWSPEVIEILGKESLKPVPTFDVRIGKD